MAERVTNLTFSGKFSMTQTQYTRGKLFLGAVGVEYAVPYAAHLNQPPVTFDIKQLHANHAVRPEALLYSFINRTQVVDEFAFCDAILPVYLRFQPDLEDPLNDAAQQIPSGANYMAQNLRVENPVVQVEGRQATVNADGSTTFSVRSVEFTIPINPPSARNIVLSVQDGLMVFLGKVR